MVRPTNDEVGYLLQAEAISGESLFLEVPSDPRAAQPWFFVQRDVGYVSKYLSMVSALLAVGLRLTGSVVPVLGLLAGLVPLLVTGLAREVGMNRDERLLAAGLVVLSPVVLVQSALPLSYLPFLVLVLAAWLLPMQSAAGRGDLGSALLVGLSASAAVCARPYDAVLLLGPAALWAAFRRRARLGALIGSAVVGALPLALAVAAYNTRAAGSPWRLPFGLLQPQDKIGFGVRRMFPEDDAHLFGLYATKRDERLRTGVAGEAC